MINQLWMDFCLIDFSPNFYYDHFQNLFDSLYGFDGSRTLLSEETLDDQDYLGSSGQQLDVNLIHQKHYDYFELQWVLGPIKGYSVTRCFFDDTGFPIQQQLFLKFYLKQVDESNQSLGIQIKSYELAHRQWNGSSYELTQTSSFQGLHRLTFGLSQQHSDSIQTVFSMDGSEFEEHQLNGFLNCSDYDEYRYIGFSGNNQLSNVAVFINQPLPSQQWLIASQETLSDHLRHQYLEHHSIQFHQEDDLFYRLSKHSSSFIHFFDTISLYGSLQNVVQSCSVQSIPLRLRFNCSDVEPLFDSGEFTQGQSIQINHNQEFPLIGLWTVIQITHSTITIEPSLTSEIQFTLGAHLVSNAQVISGSSITITLKNPNHFRVNDIIVMGSYYETEQLDQSWILESLNETQGVIRLQSMNQGPYDDEVLIKKSPIGGCHIWQKSWLDQRARYNPLHHSDQSRVLLVDDSDSIVTSLRLSDWFGNDQSVLSYCFKHLKKNQVRTTVIGDAYRCYLFIASKNESVSHSQVILFGELKSFRIPDEWMTYLIAFGSSSLEKVCHFNQAFDYPHWTILSSGHLLCQHISSQRSSQIDSHYQGTTHHQLSDAGYYIIPNLDFLTP